MIRHKLLQDFQFISKDKKIFVLKKGIILEEYIYSVKNDKIPIEKDIVDNNPLYFESLDWRNELILYLKTQKLPTPSILAKKIIPFIEDMILSSIQQSTHTSNTDDIDKREIEININKKLLTEREDDINNIKRQIREKESELNLREKRLKDKEDDIDIRLKRLEQRESEYKEDLKLLDIKEDELKNKSKELSTKELDLQDKLQDINEKERNLDILSLKSSAEIDSKYSELQERIDRDLKIVSEKEKELEIESKKLNNKEIDINHRESDLNDRVRDFEIKMDEITNKKFSELNNREFEINNKVGELKSWEEELKKLNNEISQWESMHWKFKKIPPPSAIV